jgi:hypothetical protein
MQGLNPYADKRPGFVILRWEKARVGNPRHGLRPYAERRPGCVTLGREKARVCNPWQGTAWIRNPAK